MGAKPEAVGDLPAFRITFTPPDAAPTAVAGNVHVLVRKNDGTEFDDTAGLTQVSPNVFDYVATERIDQSGNWYWRVNSNTGLIDSQEIAVSIRFAAFTAPLP